MFLFMKKQKEESSSHHHHHSPSASPFPSSSYNNYDANQLQPYTSHDSYGYDDNAYVSPFLESNHMYDHPPHENVDEHKDSSKQPLLPQHDSTHSEGDKPKTTISRPPSGRPKSGRPKSGRPKSGRPRPKSAKVTNIPHKILGSSDSSPPIDHTLHKEVPSVDKPEEKHESIPKATTDQNTYEHSLVETNEDKPKSKPRPISAKVRPISAKIRSESVVSRKSIPSRKDSLLSRLGGLSAEYEMLYGKAGDEELDSILMPSTKNESSNEHDDDDENEDDHYNGSTLFPSEQTSRASLLSYESHTLETKPLYQKSPSQESIKALLRPVQSPSKPGIRSPLQRRSTSDLNKSPVIPPIGQSPRQSLTHSMSPREIKSSTKESPKESPNEATILPRSKQTATSAQSLQHLKTTEHSSIDKAMSTQSLQETKVASQFSKQSSSLGSVSPIQATAVTRITSVQDNHSYTRNVTRELREETPHNDVGSNGLPSSVADDEFADESDDELKQVMTSYSRTIYDPIGSLPEFEKERLYPKKKSKPNIDIENQSNKSNSPHALDAEKRDSPTHDPISLINNMSENTTDKEEDYSAAGQMDGHDSSSSIELESSRSEADEVNTELGKDIDFLSFFDQENADHITTENKQSSRVSDEPIFKTPPESPDDVVAKPDEENENVVEVIRNADNGDDNMGNKTVIDPFNAENNEDSTFKKDKPSVYEELNPKTPETSEILIPEEVSGNNPLHTSQPEVAEHDVLHVNRELENGSKNENPFSEINSAMGEEEQPAGENKEKVEESGGTPEIRNSSNAFATPDELRDSFLEGSLFSRNSNPEDIELPKKPRWHPPWQLKQEIVAAANSASVPVLVVDPTNRWFATGSSDKIIKLWDTESGRQKLTIKAHKQAVRAMTFGPAGHRHLYSTGDDRQILCHDVEVNRVISQIKGSGAVMYGLSIYEPSNMLVCGGRDKLIKLYDTRTSKLVKTLRGHQNTVSCIVTNGRTGQIVSGSHDGTIRIWDVRESKCMHLLQGHKKSVRMLDKHPDQDMVLSASSERIFAWDIPTGEEIQEIKAESIAINCVTINHMGVLVAGGSNGTIHLWDFKSGKLFQKIARGKVFDSQEVPICMFSTKFDHSGTKLICSDACNVVKIYGEAYARPPLRITEFKKRRDTRASIMIQSNR